MVHSRKEYRERIETFHETLIMRGRSDREVADGKWPGNSETERSLAYQRANLTDELKRVLETYFPELRTI